MVSMDLFRIGMEEAFGLRVNPPSFEITDCDFKHLNKNIAKKLCFYLVIYSKNAIFVPS